MAELLSVALGLDPELDPFPRSGYSPRPRMCDTGLHRSHQAAAQALHRGKRWLGRGLRLLNEDALRAAVDLVGLLRAVVDGGQPVRPSSVTALSMWNTVPIWRA